MGDIPPEESLSPVDGPSLASWCNAQASGSQHVLIQTARVFLNLARGLSLLDQLIPGVVQHCHLGSMRFYPGVK